MAPGPDVRPEGEPSSLVAAVRVLRERWWLIAGAFLVCILASLFLSKTATTQYEASSQLLIGQQGNLGSVINPNAPQQTSNDPQRDQGTALLLVTSPTVAERVKTALKEQAPAGDLSSAVVASVEPDANLITVTATDPDPARAQRLANAFSEQYAAYRKETARAAVIEGEARLRSQRDQLTPENVSQRETINAALQNIIAIGAVTQGDAQVISRAGLPSSPSSPRTKRDLLLAAVLGLVIGVGLAFLLDLFDRRLKATEDFEQIFGVRALATIPQQQLPTTERERAAALEPFRILNNGLGFLAVEEPVRVLLVTSAVPGEGKSTVASGLARAAAMSGQRVVLVEADLRRPTFHLTFDLKGNRRGLSAALVGGAEADELLLDDVSGIPGLALLPAGAIPPNPAELLRSKQMIAVLQRLTAVADLVVLDAPPLLPVADSQVLLDNPLVDATLVVGRAYRSKRDEARRTRVILDRHRETNLGLVVNGMKANDAAYQYYGPIEAPKRRLARRGA
jgi:succinoglycan biosynthesis transport protein ExoP